MKTGDTVVHQTKQPISYKNEKWTYEKVTREVMLMAVYDRFAMVCVPKCAPYVCYVKELKEMK